MYKVNDNFIKLSSDENFISGRIKRANNLNKHADRKLVPELTYSGKNLYSYGWVDGITLYDCNDIDIWEKFLEFQCPSRGGHGKFQTLLPTVLPTASSGNMSSGREAAEEIKPDNRLLHD